jgi:hypothetical protein
MHHTCFNMRMWATDADYRGTLAYDATLGEHMRLITTTIPVPLHASASVGGLGRKPGWEPGGEAGIIHYVSSHPAHTFFQAATTFLFPLTAVRQLQHSQNDVDINDVVGCQSPVHRISADGQGQRIQQWQESVDNKKRKQP